MLIIIVKALVDINAAIDINKKDSNYFNQRGFCLDKLERYQEALNDYESAIKLDPKHGGVWNDMSALLNLMGYHET